MMRRLLMVAALAWGCSTATSSNPDLSSASLGTDLASADLACSCRLYSNYCEGCACLPLRTDQPDPVCTGMMVSCLTDPCSGKSAVCSGGQCVLQ